MSRHTWQWWMDRAKKIMREDRTNLFDLVEALGNVLDDPAWQKTVSKDGKSPTAEIEHMIRSSCGICFANLRAMRKMFPKKIQWTGGDLAKMEQDVIQAAVAKMKKVQQKSSPHKPRNTETKEDEPKRDSRHFVQEIAELKDENQKLRNDNAILQVRNEELVARIGTLEQALDALAPKRKTA